MKRRYAATIHIKCEAEVNDKIEQLVLGGSDKLQVKYIFIKSFTQKYQTYYVHFI